MIKMIRGFRRGALIGGLLAMTSLIAAAQPAAPSTPPAPASRPVPAESYAWNNVTIVGGGFVTGIIFHPKQPGLMYARTDIGGAYRWEPQAQRWTCLNDWAGLDDWNMYGIESLAIDPSDPNRLYLAAGTYTNDWAGNGAILRSADQGRTWQRTNLPFKLGGNENGRSMGERLAVDPHDGRVLYFGTRHQGLWKSTDSGKTWKAVEHFPVRQTPDGIGVGFVLFDPAGGSDAQPTKTIYVGVASKETHLYRSTDAGATWHAVAGQTPGFLPHHGVLADDGSLYLTYGNGPGPNGMTDGAVRKYDTRSGQWSDITPLKPGSRPDAGHFGYAGLAVDAQHPRTLMVATMDRWYPGDDIFRSTDSGRTWKSLKPLTRRDSSLSPFLNWGHDEPELGHWIGDIEIDPFNSNHALYVTGATIWRTADLTSVDRDQISHWTVGAAGLEETAVNELISPPQGAHLLSALSDIGGFRHDDFSVSPPAGVWTNPIINSLSDLDFAQAKPAFVVRVGSGKPGQRGAWSEDGGTTWKPFAAEPQAEGAGSIAVSADAARILWSPRKGAVSLTSDHGKTWTAVPGVPDGARIVADRVNPLAFYAFDASTGRLYTSTDGGAHFTPGRQTLPEGGGKLRAVAGHEGHLWLPAGEAGLYRSTDAGATFTRLPTVADARAVGFGHAAPGAPYEAIYLTGRIGTTYGAFRSDDQGATWVCLTDDQHQFGSIGLTIIGDPRLYGRAYLGTNGRGILYGDPKGKGW